VAPFCDYAHTDPNRERRRRVRGHARRRCGAGPASTTCV